MIPKSELAALRVVSRQLFGQLPLAVELWTAEKMHCQRERILAIALEADTEEEMRVSVIACLDKELWDEIDLATCSEGRILEKEAELLAQQRVAEV